jgi:hypothetical protein
MKKIDVMDRAQIKQILRSRGVLAIGDVQHQRSGAFQLWWHNTDDGVCNCCDTNRSESGAGIETVNLNEALKTLWRNRDSLFLCGKRRGNGEAS